MMSLEIRSASVSGGIYLFISFFHSFLLSFFRSMGIRGYQNTRRMKGVFHNLNLSRESRVPSRNPRCCVYVYVR